MIYLLSVMDDTFDVYDDSKPVETRRLGEISLMSDGWAAYRRGETERIGTYEDAQGALIELARLVRS